MAKFESRKLEKRRVSGAGDFTLDEEDPRDDAVEVATELIEAESQETHSMVEVRQPPDGHLQCVLQFSARCRPPSWIAV